MSPKEYSDKQAAIVISQMDDEQLASELRNPIRATLGFEKGNYHLFISEALARLLTKNNNASK